MSFRFGSVKHQQAFTVIEVIAVIVLIGILSVSVAPKLIGTREYNARTTMAQFISHLRLVQLKALNQRGVCHNLVFETVGSEQVFGIPNNSTSSCGTTTASDTRIELGDTTISLVNGSTNAVIKASPSLVFDSDGIATTTGGGDCAGACKLRLSAGETLYMCIESQGYVHSVASGYVCN